MSKVHQFQTDSYTLTLVDEKRNQYIQISGFTGKDGSAYLTMNSGVEINYAKFSYHPREKRFQYAFTDELWKVLDVAGKGKPNREKIKSKVVDLKGNQILCAMYIDKSSLYRKGIPESTELNINYPDNKVFRVIFSLENGVPNVSHNFVDKGNEWQAAVESERNKIHSANDKLRTPEISGVAQLMNDFEFPWKMLCIGI